MILHVNYLPQARKAAAKEVVPTLFSLLEEGWGDPSLLAHLRVHLDWIQYRHNFREAVTLRRTFTGRGEPLPPIELAIDVRQARPETFREELTRALDLTRSDRDLRDGVILEPFGLCRSSVIWSFNRLFWHHLTAWEEAAGHSYDQALLGGKSDANHPEAVADAVTEFWTLLEDLEGRSQLPPEIFVLEIGVGTT